MRTLWPFHGRAAQLAAIRSALSTGGAVLAGPAGVGKSRLAAEAVGEAGDLVRVLATAAASGIPLGAMAHLLPPHPPEGNMIRWAADALPGRRPLLLVDDAHLLDSASAALVLHLVVSGRARVLATVRSGERAPDAVTALWKDDLLQRIELGPLELEEAGRVLTGALGGEVEGPTVRRLWRAGGGNVLFLRELVLAGESSSALAERHGVWRWQGEISVTTRLRELVEGRIGEITPAEREALEFVAYGEPLAAGLLAGLAPMETVRGLEDRQLVTVSPEDLSVRLAHPLYGEVIRAGCGELRTREVLSRLADAVEAAGSDSGEDALRVAVWRLDSATADDPAPLMRACRTARSRRDLELAVRLGRAALAAGGGVPAGVLLASVLTYSDRYDETEAVLLGLAAEPMDDMTRADFARVHALNLVWGYGRGEEACEVLESAAAAMTEPEPRQGALIIRTAIEHFMGRFSQTRRTIEQVLRMGPPSPAVAIGLAAMEANVLPHEGRGEQALALVDRTLATIGGLPEALPTITMALVVPGAVAAVMTGDLAAAWRYAEIGYRIGEDHGGWSRAVVGAGALRAQVCRLRGQPAEAIRWCRQGLGGLRGRTLHAGPCLAELAHAYALTGDVAAVQATMDLSNELALKVGHQAEFAFRLAEPWVLAARGDVTGAVAAAHGTAEAARDLPAYALFALHDLVRLGAAELVSDRLDRLAGRIGGALAPVFARHARAMGDGGPVPRELDAVSEAFERLGLLLHAAEASAQAARGYRLMGVVRAERAAETRAWALAGRCDGARTPALAGLAVPELTARQREIAHLAASGLSNRDIAERLTLSIRTVANTLVHVYERIGVNRREELGAILRVMNRGAGPGPSPAHGPVARWGDTTRADAPGAPGASA
ncbi:LuxR C-terminal-related transcriptional regulator [Planotetraspora phitsanulokensis]|uniref:LuxR C-terminal-related transcriptional regulator n=1 Tax=Planotetraspora phitsanulokensis TaxID=575192 RepID=UPI00194F19D5|nr:LuxR C-terminal-related transcriptional regulator [Planotetraspora phitsanulokensis]